MEIEKLSSDLLDVIEEFDRSAAPFGLYAARDILLESNPKQILGDFSKLAKRQPELAYLQSFIELISHVSEWVKQNESRFGFEVQGFGSVDLRLVRISRIKVRKFGSHFRLDKQENFTERWERLNLDDRISALWKRPNEFDRYSPIDAKMVLFIGFDRAMWPFEREIMSLKPHQNREAHTTTFVSRQWEDLYERNFRVRAVVWSRVQTTSETSLNI